MVVFDTAVADLTEKLTDPVALLFGYSGIFGSVMASIPAIKTTLVVFDTAVADLTRN